MQTVRTTLIRIHRFHSALTHQRALQLRAHNGTAALSRSPPSSTRILVVAARTSLQLTAAQCSHSAFAFASNRRSLHSTRSMDQAASAAVAPSASLSVAADATVPSALVDAVISAVSNDAASAVAAPASADTSSPPLKKQRVKAPQAGGSRLFASASSSSASPAPAVQSEPPLMVCIIGGGLAGLSVALSLQRVGIKCRVFERDASASVRKQGFGLTLTNSEVGALAQLGVLDACLQQDCPSTCHYVFDKRGDVLGYFGRAFLPPDLLAKQQEAQMRAASAAANGAANNGTPAQAASSSSAAVVSPQTVANGKSDAQGSSAAASPSPSPEDGAASSLPLPSPPPLSLPQPSPSPSPAPARWWSSANLRIPRQDLRQLLYERLAPDTIVWGARIRDYTEDGEGVTVHFHDGSDFRCSMLVGADGIHSAVRRMQDEKAREKNAGLRFLQVAAIVGLSPAMHPLLDARGFYAMGDRHRLFTMPFRAPQVDGEGRVVKEPLTMWQLSFAETDEAAARALASTPPEQLLAVALQRTSDWMEPVQTLLGATPLANVWATALYDRDARRLRTRQQASRVTVVGDACHPMSMFKGQGANQALQDGPLLAQMLTLVDKNTPRAALDAHGRPVLTREALLNRIRRFESQMVQRASSRVLASRQAAAHLHSDAAALPSDFYGVGGVALDSDQLMRVLQRCRETRVGAQLGANLDDAFRVLLDETVPPAERDASRKPPKEDM